MFDVIVAGGSYAGMAAALQLVRARRKVAIVDAGQRRNRYASASHGLLGQDGRAPGASREEKGFAVRTAQGETLAGKRLVLATGVQDRLPDVPGLRERWGRSVHHCPYCDGYELEQDALGVLAVGELSMHQALLSKT